MSYNKLFYMMLVIITLSDKQGKVDAREKYK